MDSLSRELMAHGDVDRALRNLLQRGLPREGRGRPTGGLRSLLGRLKQQRQRQLERYNLDSLFDDLKERLQDIVDAERAGIDRRVDEARRQVSEAGEHAEDLQGPMRVLDDRARRSVETLDALPESAAGAIGELRGYDFMDPEARQRFQDLLDSLSQQMVQSLFSSLRDQIAGLTREQMDELGDMVRAINRMLQDRAMGLEPDFHGFMDQFGPYFDPDRPSDLDELIDLLRGQMAVMQSLVDSMTPEMRQELTSLMRSAVDSDLLAELNELASEMALMFPPGELGREYSFMGDDPATLEQAMDVIGQLQEMDDLEKRIREVARGGRIEDIDPGQVEQHLEEDARRELERLQQVARQLEDAGYLRRKGDRLELTPKAVRRLAQKTLGEIFSDLSKGRLGAHDIRERGHGGEHTGETKPYEFGDLFDVDMQRSVFNAILRDGPGVPIRMAPQDMEVHRSEHQTQVATVLLLDQSRSMGLFDSFSAAKRVALALYYLVLSRFSRDRLHIIGFSDYAMEIRGDNLPELTWNSWTPGTNMHHALMMSRKILARENAANKQVLMITDGEPTAHLEGGQAYFSYPPSYRTIEETLKEVKRCTRERITINTFMLEANSSLIDFVDQMTRINGGRAFYTTPSQLGRYVMVDYLNGRRKRIG